MVTFSPTGWAARYKDPEYPNLVVQEAVERFSEDGDALVVDRRYGTLIPARARTGFVGLVECGRMMSVVPAPPGWRVGGQTDDGYAWSDPVVAWLVDETGTGYPLIRDGRHLTMVEDAVSEYTLSGPDDPDPSVKPDTDSDGGDGRSVGEAVQ
ncbi:hypothetical protein GCM10012275_61140 [Longimycelium tulufanense]|uniref:Uncharacterized protein n=1 Tax=Longimycelium tulufanense TaxID=907463 RepID=A0A8J3CLC1_9PSEU|nr:hypothetical protein [Longimycelium tulufanense]GGM82280.1 hypothetical protein GCM10012275_61140 [Longimycelium tulufanense]